MENTTFKMVYVGKDMGESPYLIGQTEVTQGLWKAVMGNNPSCWQGDDLPVEQVSWHDCQTFIGKPNAITGQQFRLPTEAEWECAASRKDRWMHPSNEWYSGNANEVCWHSGNSGGHTHPAAGKGANQLSLYDMCGNVWEWCQDSYNAGESRAYRGGSEFKPNMCTVKSRCLGAPDFKHHGLCLRLAMTP